MKNRFDSIDQVNNLREIQALRRLSPHDHVITLEEVLYDQPTGRLALVFELMDANLYELIRGRRHYLNPQLIKSYMWQLMKSLDHMHKKGIFHRDIKPENILIESSTEIGKGLKLADFGSCRGIYSKQPYTEYISTRWYRAPECLLTDGYYGPEMDLWGAGCVMFEITSLYPLFPGSNEVDQISRIHKVLGTPTPEIMTKLKGKGASHISFDFPESKGVGIGQLIPHASADLTDLIIKLLKYDASERITSREAMRHPYFKETRDSEIKRLQHTDGNGNSSASIAAATGAGGATTDGAITVSSTKGNTNNSSKIPVGKQSSQSQALSANSSMASLSQANSGVPVGNKAPILNTGKAFPSIVAQNSFHADTKPLQPSTIKTGGPSSIKQSSMIPTASSNSSGASSSLPPIMSSINNNGGGGGMFSSVQNQSQRSLQAAAAVNNNNNNNNASAFSSIGTSNTINNQVATGAGAGSSLKKKKKYRAVNIPQRSSQNSNNTENVMKTYGVPRNGLASLETSSKVLASAADQGGMKAGANDIKQLVPTAPSNSNFGALRYQGGGGGAGGAKK